MNNRWNKKALFAAIICCMVTYATVTVYAKDKKPSEYARQGFVAGAVLGYIMSNDCTQEEWDNNTCDNNVWELMGAYSMAGGAAGYLYGTLVKDKNSFMLLNAEANMTPLEGKR